MLTLKGQYKRVTASDTAQVEFRFPSGAQSHVLLDWSDATRTDADADAADAFVQVTVDGVQEPLANLNLVTGVLQTHDSVRSLVDSGNSLVVEEEDRTGGNATAGLNKLVAAIINEQVAASPVERNLPLAEIAPDFDTVMPSFHAVDACHRSWDETAGKEFVHVSNVA